MNIHPILTRADEKATLAEIAALMANDPGPGTPQGDRLAILVTPAQAYESKQVPIGKPDAGEP